MKRVSIADIMRETGLSRATVDRVLNGRGKVHQRTRDAVEHAMRMLSAPASSPSAAGPSADIVLRLGRGMTGQMRAAWERRQPSGAFHDLYQAEEAEILDVVSSLCEDAARPLIVAAKNTDRLAARLEEARGRGKRIIAVVSDLAANARDVFLGIDNRAAGQTAAFLIGRMLGDRSAAVGVVLGDLAFRCHEDREIGFRTGLRAHFPRLSLAGEAQGEDSAELTRAAVLRLLKEQPALTAIYNVGGGNAGLCEAVREAGREILVVAHEANAVTTPLLRDGAIDYVIASDPALLVDQALELAGAGALPVPRDEILNDFGVYTRFNIPHFTPIR
ncbi:LacI family DNA-binding transcriptional regulator [Gellertiella hungarica]|uniref:LacI family transcriptional regulator n=1 Tax=Gellertiella hungarica TaxID=1572859 RepID=A0A7W6NL80_9HYPH|nr:LacI family DNA-binding transcriptional regulator [Gellertiella hungarica]MBB4065633.1 LacI family transcriptional regulator [Gellertiella hungarica]